LAIEASRYEDPEEKSTSLAGGFAVYGPQNPLEDTPLHEAVRRVQVVCYSGGPLPEPARQDWGDLAKWLRVAEDQEPDRNKKAARAAASLVRWAVAESQRVDLDAGEPPVVEEQVSGTDQAPVEYLMNWRAILDALKLPNDEESRGKVRRLNEQFDGPIIISTQGSQPKVSKAKLLTWWNGLEDRFEELKQRRADRDGTVAEHFSYGETGTVFPGISGGEKKRREDRRD